MTHALKFMVCEDFVKYKHIQCYFTYFLLILETWRDPLLTGCLNFQKIGFNDWKRCKWNSMSNSDLHRSILKKLKIFYNTLVESAIMWCATATTMEYAVWISMKSRQIFCIKCWSASNPISVSQNLEPIYITHCLLLPQPCPEVNLMCAKLCKLKWWK